MGDRENDNRLTARAISRLLDFQGEEVAEEENPSIREAELPESVEAPKIVHLEFGDPIAAAVAEETSSDDWTEAVGRSKRRMIDLNGS